MKMLNTLASIFTAVVDNAVAVCKTEFLGDSGNCFENFCHINAVVRIYFICTADMCFGNNKYMNGSHGVDVLECINIFVFVYF